MLKGVYAPDWMSFFTDLDWRPHASRRDATLCSKTETPKYLITVTPYEKTPTRQRTQNIWR